MFGFLGKNTNKNEANIKKKSEKINKKNEETCIR